MLNLKHFLLISNTVRYFLSNVLSQRVENYYNETKSFEKNGSLYIYYSYILMGLSSLEQACEPKVFSINK